MQPSGLRLMTASIYAFRVTYCEVRIASGDTCTFPRGLGRDGRTGKLSVSKFRAVPVAGANQDLAVHVTFSIASIFVPSENAVRGGNAELRVNIRNLHYTARPANIQLAIVGENAVAATPLGREVSSHRGTVNNWLHVGNQNRLNDMARELNLANWAGITAALNVFTGPTLTAIQNGLAASIRLEINDNLMPPELRGFVPIAVNFA